MLKELIYKWTKKKEEKIKQNIMEGYRYRRLLTFCQLHQKLNFHHVSDDVILCILLYRGVLK